MSRAMFRRPDGRDGSYGDWAAEIAARWSSLSAAEKTASRDAAAARLASQVKAQASGPTLLHLYDEIGWFGVWPADVVAALSDIKGDVEVHLNSPGGNVFDGLAIYAALRERKGGVGVVVDGLAASAASFIAMAAAPGRLEMTPNGTMMIHDAWGMCVGGAGDMAAMAATLEQQSQNIASIYAERGGRSAAEYRDLMRAETWAVGQEAVDLRLADRIRRTVPDDAAPPLAPAATWQVTILAAAPAKAAEDHGSFDGIHNHAHPSYGATGEDGPFHTHEHVHENDSNHNHDHEPDDDDEIGMRSRRDVRAASVDESAWDGNAAMAGCSSAADFRAICAGEHSAGDPDERQHWALPHHRHPGAPPNRAGVNNAASRLPQTQDLKDRAAAEAHIKAHQASMGDGDADDDGTSNHAMPAWLAKALTAKEAAGR